MQKYLFQRAAAPILIRRVHKAKDTRNAAHAVVKTQEEQPGGLGTRQQQVFDVITRHPKGISNSEIAAQLGWPINRVTPRTLELREKGYVVPADKRECTITRSVVQTWRTK